MSYVKKHGAVVSDLTHFPYHLINMQVSLIDLIIMQIKLID
jgi:hypothetical protein